MALRRIQNRWISSDVRPCNQTVVILQRYLDILDRLLPHSDVLRHSRMRPVPSICKEVPPPNLPSLSLFSHLETSRSQRRDPAQVSSISVTPHGRIFCPSVHQAFPHTGPRIGELWRRPCTLSHHHTMTSHPGKPQTRP